MAWLQLQIIVENIWGQNQFLICLQRFRMFMLGFDYDAVSLAGMYNHACLVVQVGDSEESFCVCQDEELFVRSFCASLPCSE